MTQLAADHARPQPRRTLPIRTVSAVAGQPVLEYDSLLAGLDGSIRPMPVRVVVSDVLQRMDVRVVFAILTEFRALEDAWQTAIKERDEALDLASRQAAEIERLKNQVQGHKNFQKGK